MSNKTYVQNAMDKIYGEKDDFILIGLTGRTGSGCTTAANILKSKKGKINHNLSNELTLNIITNQQRKEKIIKKFIENKWESFYVISVRLFIFSKFAEDFEGSKKIYKIQPPGGDGNKSEELNEIKLSEEQEKIAASVKKS